MTLRINNSYMNNFAYEYKQPIFPVAFSVFCTVLTSPIHNFLYKQLFSGPEGVVYTQSTVYIILLYKHVVYKHLSL